jgi:hypothetical protein
MTGWTNEEAFGCCQRSDTFIGRVSLSLRACTDYLQEYRSSKMSDDVSDNQLVLMQTDSTKLDEHYKEFNAQFNKPTTSVDDVDDLVSADA